MAYDLELADRIRGQVSGEDGITEQRMFGGLAFLVGGNMAVAASGKGGILVRVDPTATDLIGEHAQPAVMGGREMRGWLRVDAAALDDDDLLAAWVGRGVAYARSLPAKKPRRRR